MSGGQITVESLFQVVILLDVSKTFSKALISNQFAKQVYAAKFETYGAWKAQRCAYN